MPSSRGISRNEYWMMRGEPTYVTPAPVRDADAWNRMMDLMHDPGDIDPDHECSHGHAHCYRH